VVSDLLALNKELTFSTVEGKFRTSNNMSELYTSIVFSKC